MSDIRALTEQEVFDRVYTHFVTNGNSRGVNVFKDCEYRTSEGLVCAIGLFIPIEEYNKELESALPENLREMVPTLGILLDNVSDNFLNDLQRIHDNEKGCTLTITGKRLVVSINSDIKDRLILFAKAYGLKEPE